MTAEEQQIKLYLASLAGLAGELSRAEPIDKALWEEAQSALLTAAKGIEAGDHRLPMLGVRGGPLSLLTDRLRKARGSR